MCRQHGLTAALAALVALQATGSAYAAPAETRLVLGRLSNVYDQYAHVGAGLALAQVFVADQALPNVTAPQPGPDMVTATRVQFTVEQPGDADTGSEELVRMVPTDQGALKCFGATELSIYFYNQAAQTAAGRATLHLQLLDGAGCLDATGGCASKADTEVWSAAVDEADLDTSGHWVHARVPVAALSAISAPPGANSVLDLEALAGWAIEVRLDAAGSAGSTSSGSFVVSSFACAGDDVFGAQLGRSVPVWDSLVSDLMAFTQAAGIVIPDMNMTAHPDGALGVTTPVLAMDYLVAFTEAWGGVTNFQYFAKAGSVFDLSEATHIEMDLMVTQPSRPSGVLEFRFIALDASACAGDCTEMAVNEVYHHYSGAIELGPTWTTLSIPLLTTAGMSGFLKGSFGSIGNNYLDKNQIKGVVLELYGNPAGLLTAGGGLAVTRLRAVKEPLSPRPRTRTEHVASVVAVDPAPMLELVDQHSLPCSDLCSTHAGCIAFQAVADTCQLFDKLEAAKLELKRTRTSHLELTVMTETIWGMPEACGPSGACACSADTIDCSNRGLKTVPLISEEAGATVTTLDLSGNGDLVVIVEGALRNLPRLTLLRARGASLAFAAPPSHVESLDLDTSSLVNAGTAEVCCLGSTVRKIVGTSDEPAEEVVCTSIQGVAPLCADCHMMPSYTYEAERDPLAIIRPNSLFHDGVNNGETCGELCSRTKECSHFTWDGRHTVQEKRCYLLTEGVGLLRTEGPDFWTDPWAGVPGYVSGYVARTRALEHDYTVRLDPPAPADAKGNMYIGPENGFRARFGVHLGNQPIRGMVWVEPRFRMLSADLATELGVTATVTPPVAKISEAEWNTTFYFDVVLGVPDGVSGSLQAVITNVVSACDESFTLHPEQDDWLTIPTEIYLHVPEENLNRSPGIKAVARGLAAINTLTAVCLLLWTVIKRAHPVVKASQATFLALFAVGGIISGLAILPVTWDDAGAEELSREGEYGLASAGCMLQMWLYGLGFVLTFAPLFAKTWRLSKIINVKDMKRVKISNGRVYMLCAVLCGIEAVILLCWQLAAPWKYQRIVRVTDEAGSPTDIGDTALVGAPGDDDNGGLSGSAYIFRRNQGGPDAWGQVAKLTASDGAENDQFGYAVSLSGNTALVGADGNDDGGSSSGSAYIFHRNQGGTNAWGQVAKLTASDAAENDDFGWAVSLSGNTALVGAYGNDDNGGLSGSAYIFQLGQGGSNAWGQVAKLTASDGAENDQFGYAVSLSGNTALVGADGNDDGGSSSGSAYIFHRNQGGTNAWGQVAKLTASDAAENDDFGRAVSLSGDTALVGADGDGNGLGSTYIFHRNQNGTNAWGQVAKLTASDAAERDWFGGAVALSGDTALVGADGDGNGLGSAYIFSTGLVPTPTTAPTAAPTTAPTTAPIATPTAAPFIAPTAAPTDSPTQGPTSSPSTTPSASPTSAPSRIPTGSPSYAPTEVGETRSPTTSPSSSPTSSPTSSPASSPTEEGETRSPSTSPTVASETTATTAAPTAAEEAAGLGVGAIVGIAAGALAAAAATAFFVRKQSKPAGPVGYDEEAASKVASVSSDNPGYGLQH